jgi:hypothetical protein
LYLPTGRSETFSGVPYAASAFESGS